MVIKKFLSHYLREIVYGGNDGIVTTFAVVAGFNGAHIREESLVSSSFLTVLLFGFANLFADATSMGLGNFLSIRSNQDVYKAEKEKEMYEIRNFTDREKKETLNILMQKGFSRKQGEKLTDIFATNKDYWVEFMMRDELNMPNPNKDNPYLTGLATFSSFISFGLIPLIPYILSIPSQNLFLTSIVFTFFALMILGFIRWKLTKETIIHSLGQVVFVGGLSSLVAYIIGTFFAGYIV